MCIVNSVGVWPKWVCQIGAVCDVLVVLQLGLCVILLCTCVCVCVTPDCGNSSGVVCIEQRVCDVGSVIHACVYGLNCGGEIGDCCCGWDSICWVV